jgi:N-methylhydantoinase A
MEPIAAASGIVRIVDSQMADLVRKVLLQGGHDPRRFALVAFGGAAALHVGAYAPEVGVAEVLISPSAPVFSALGLALADYKRVYEVSDPMRMPAPGERIGMIFAGLERTALEDAGRAHLEQAPLLTRSVDLRFRRQTHEVQVPLTDEIVDDTAVALLCERFAIEYERIYGPATAYRPAGIEASTFRIVATLRTQRPETHAMTLADPSPRPARLGDRPVYFSDWIDQTPVYAAEMLRPGHRVDGPAVVDGRATTLVIHPGQTVRVEREGTLRMQLSSSA